ncbi:MAG TPA: hypothetical protein VI076_09740 [Actinopolymorphaceae bacterium]
MAEPYVYAIDRSEYDGDWRNLTMAESRQSLSGRDPAEIARAILEGWIVDHPEDLAGGERVQVFGDDPLEYPPDDQTHVRVRVYRGDLVTREPEPAAAAYLVDVPGE